MLTASKQGQTLLELRDITLVYRAQPVLRNIQWSVTAGQQWACLGPNSAGKTSLAKVISGQTPQVAGQQIHAPYLRKHGVAYVCFEQAKALCARDKKLDDSEFRPDANDPGTSVQSLILDGKEPDKNFMEWSKRLQMDHFLHRGLRYISTGEMRKALLVRALMSQPGLLILDSPLDGLDHRSQQEMRAILSELLQSQLSVLLLCRQPEDIPVGITHVLVLNQGAVLACDTQQNIMKNAAVAALMQPGLARLGTLPAPAPRTYNLVPGQPLLQLRNVSVQYGDHTVLDNVDWTLAAGTHCCISGPNGCGKTTLLSLITGENHKAYGQDITLFGIRRGSGESVWDIKQKFGLLDTQLQLSFARNMRVLAVVLSGFFDSIGLYDAWSDQQRDIADHWLAALGLADFTRDRFDTLSFGLQRMVLLARAMVKSPSILILDEPTLGLDGHHRKLMLRAIDHIAENSTTHIIFVSHSAGETPRCINQHLLFQPRDNGFDVVCQET